MSHIEAGNYVEGSGFKGVRVVVTGRGAVSPLGNDVKQTLEGIFAGRSGVESIDPPFNSRVHFAARVKDFVPPDVFDRSDLKNRVHRSALYSTAATLEAMMDAGLPIDVDSVDDIVGIRIGSGVAGASFVAEMQEGFTRRGDKGVPPGSVFQILTERVASVVSMKAKITGPTASSVAACATGNQNIIDALRLITAGDAHRMYAGATEVVEQMGMSAFSQIRALSTRNDNPQTASRPFDKERDGFVMSEGATVLHLEELNHALKRGAHIYAEIRGYAETADAEGEALPNGIGSEMAMRRALQKANLKPSDIDYINPHGTSTLQGDEVELEAMLRVFKDCNPRPLVSATKSMLGHQAGPAGATEALICIESINKGIVPPTINLDNPINDYFDYVPNVARKATIRHAMSNSFGFGGLNTVLILSEYKN